MRVYGLMKARNRQNSKDSDCHGVIGGFRLPWRTIKQISTGLFFFCLFEKFGRICIFDVCYYEFIYICTWQMYNFGLYANLSIQRLVHKQQVFDRVFSKQTKKQKTRSECCWTSWDFPCLISIVDSQTTSIYIFHFPYFHPELIGLCNIYMHIRKHIWPLLLLLLLFCVFVWISASSYACIIIHTI